MKHLFAKVALAALMALGLGGAAASARQTVVAQQNVASGVVLDASGSGVIGAGVVVKGTSIGSVTGLDGQFSISGVEPGVTLEISCIGYRSVEVVWNGGPISVVLEEDSEMLEETVVIGYGVQKKSVVTAAIAKVSAEDLRNVQPTRVDDVLKGLTSGVSVTSASGQPGSSPQVRVRGTGTINNSNPLYIVDGMHIDGGIDYLNPTDIESIEVLKDAASGAIYGARAANGVILVTTKKGAAGKTHVSYDFQYGISSPWRKLPVLNATEYAIMMNEMELNSGNPIRFQDPYSFGVGTDWQDVVFNYNAPQQSHQLSASGGSNSLNYYVSAGYQKQEGIVGGNYEHSNYERLSLRTNLNATLFDVRSERSFLNKMEVGLNTSYARINTRGITENSEFGGPLGSAIGMAPTINPYASEAESAAILAAAAAAGANPVYDKISGKLLTVVDGVVYNEMNNPLADLSTPTAYYDSDKIVGSANASLNIWDNLRFTTTFGYDLSFWGSEGYNFTHYKSSKNYRNTTDGYKSMNRAFVWQIENVLSYDKQFGKHYLGLTLGQSATSNMGGGVGATRRGLLEENPYKAGIWFTNAQDYSETDLGYGSKYNPHRLSSLFARLSYNYDERYMFQATVRRDGSSNFGANHLYGVFPSFSFGWNFTNEAFMENVNWLNMGKFRASWGKNGNEAIGQYTFTTTMYQGNNYVFGTGANALIINGAKPSGFANADVHWEESVQTDLGLDLAFLQSSITFSVDWFNKITNGMLMTRPIPAYAGDSAPTANVGSMLNRGWEFELGYKRQMGEFFLQASANATWLHNELIELGNDTGWQNYDTHKIGTLTRGQNGYPFPYFYGWKTDGIFQNVDEVNSYVNADGALLQPNAVPGDVRFKDLDGDGDIDDDDRGMIGKGMPDWAYGLNLNLSWKGFDLGLVFQGVQGVQVFNVTRRTDLAYVNLPKWVLNRWTGEGTSNTVPRFTVLNDPNQNWRTSDLWVEDGAYFRLKNAQLGYTLPSKLTKKFFISSLRLYLAAQNLFTLTKYRGFDPEISSASTSLGVDRGVYPQARTFFMGVNVGFDGRQSVQVESSSIDAAALAACKADAAALAAAKAEAERTAAARLAEAEATIQALTEENARLKSQPKAVENKLFDQPVIAYFTIGKSVLSATETEHVKAAARNILATGGKVKFTLAGHADTGTGSEARNAKLAAERAQTVYNLMKEMGVDSGLFTVSSSVEDIFDTPEFNRCVIIEKQ